MSYLLWYVVRDAAQAHPHRLAVSDGRGELTYSQLESDSLRVAGLLQAAGVRPGDRVGILAAKSVRCVAAMVGVLRAGASYVPVDPKGPGLRSKYILANAGVRFLVTQAGLVRSVGLQPGAEGIPEAACILLLDDQGPQMAPGADDRFRAWGDLPEAPTDGDLPLRNEFDPAYIL